MKKILLLLFLMIFSLGYTQPGAGPTTPIARNAWDVMSVFSDAYTPVAGTRNYNPNWGQSGAGAVITAGTDNVWRASNLNYQGLDFGSNINASAMTTFHVDVYTGSANVETTLRFSQINNGGGERFVDLHSLQPLTPNTWISYDIPLTVWTSQSGFQVNNLFQFKIEGSGGKTVYLDNMYFYRPATTQPPTYGAFTVPAQLVGAAPLTLTAPTSNNTSPFTYTSSNTAVAMISGNTVTIVGAGTSTITASQVADGTYSAGSTTASLVVTPTAAPIPPARNTWDVMSYYSDSYTPTATPTWGGQTSGITIEGNTTRVLSSYLFGQIAFANVNVSAMTTLHLDIFSIDQTPTWIWLNNSRYIAPTPINGWTSLDIPLSTFTVADLSAINIVKIENPNGAGALKNAYVDNIYFYRAATDTPPTLGAFTVPSPKTFGDAPFVLTNPTSNSSGAWSYSSSPAGVVTFSGNTATIVSGGTTTITATQAAVPGVYGAGTATASLVVNFPAPGASPVPPVRDPASVVSMYTGTPTVYANGTTAVQAAWSTGSTSSNFSFANGTNTCIQVNNLGFFGLVTNGANFSVVGMSTLHVDIYVNTPMPSMILNLLAPGDRNYSTGSLSAGWNSLDIPLSTYPGALNDIYGIKFEQSGGTPRQIYIDNVYFYTGGTPVITNFPAIGKVMGAAPFNLTTPTSNSPGTFTYTSSNLAVAMISGSTVTLMGAGTSTITATQAASGFFTEGSIQATLTVTGSNVPLSGPTAPPVRNAWDAFSVFSDQASYTVVPGTRNYNPGWGQAGTGTVIDLGSGDNVWRASNLNYQGIVFGSNVDVSAMTHFHVDVWTIDETSLQFFQISNTTGERSVALTPLNQGSWNSYDIPLTAWTNQSGFTVTALKEFKIVGSGGKTVYLDNMYFYRPATTQPPTLGAFTVPAKVVGDANFNLTAPTSNSSGAFSYTSSNTAVAMISGSTVTIMGAGTSTITATQAADGPYGTAFTTATLTVTPAAAANPPVRNTWDVVSYYSHAYTNASPPNWDGGSDISIAGNTTRFLNEYTLATLNFASVNVSAMTTLHIDIFSVNQNPTWIRVNGVQFVATTPVNGWTSLDIPLSSFTGLNLAAVTNVQIFNPTGAEVPRKNAYVDNVYFYRAATLPPPTVGTFTVPTKVLGDAPFSLTPPTSNNTSSFTYMVANSSIATISGNTVTVIGGGTTTITASQVGDGTFGPSSTTATFIVTYPDPGPSPVPPVREPARVISLYTGTPAVYANAPNYNLVQAPWSAGSTSVSEVPNGTNTCLRVNNLGFVGFADQTERRLNLTGTGMTHMHIDIYLDAPLSNLFVVLLAPGDRFYNYTGSLVAGWNSLSIPLTAYPGALNDIYGLKLEQNVGPARRIFVDNFYFSNDLYTFYEDFDGDTFGNMASTVLAETQPAGYVTNSTDCDDNDNAVWQSGDYYVDFDEDGYSFDGVLYSVCYGETVDSFYSLTSLGIDCDDFNPSLYRSGEFFTDVDGDGYSTTPLTTSIICYGAMTPAGQSLAVNTEVDCNDNVASIYPGAPEVCFDGILQNCNGTLADGCAPVLVNMISSYCGATLPFILSTVTAENPNLPSGTTETGYRFEIKNLTTSEVRILDRPIRNFKLTMTDIYEYSTTYEVRVAIRVNSEWQPYGATCLMSTPSIPTTQVVGGQCGATLPLIFSTVTCNTVNSANQYRFRVVNAANIAEVQTIDRPVNNLKLTQLTTYPVQYNTTYNVSVQVRVVIDGAEIWSNYGSVCPITTPTFPTTQVQLSQCELMATSNTQQISLDIFSGTSVYRVSLTNAGLAYMQTIDRTSPNFTLSMFTGLQAATTYTVAVSIKLNGVWGPYGKPCSVTTPGALTRPVRTIDNSTKEFSVIAFPNPFATTFALDVKTSSATDVNVSVYDMTGRLLEVRTAKAEDLLDFNLGDRYPSGVYNIVVNQGLEVKTIRVIKK